MMSKLFKCMGADRGRPREANRTYPLILQRKSFQKKIAIINICSAFQKVSFLGHQYLEYLHVPLYGPTFKEFQRENELPCSILESHMSGSSLAVYARWNALKSTILML